MTLAEMIHATLQPLVDGRVYPAGTAGDAALPRVTYLTAGGRPINYLEGALPDRDQTRVQISVWAPTVIAVQELCKSVDAAMAASAHFTARRLGGPVSVYEDDAQIHGQHQDFMVDHAR